MVRSAKNLLLIAVTALTLSACSYFDAGSKGPDTSLAPPPPQTIDITNKNLGGPPDEAPMMMDNMPLAATAPQKPVSPPPSFSDVTRTASKGSVEIFPFDAAGASPSPARNNVGSPAVPQALPMGHGVMAKPGVEIFPLDEQMASGFGGGSLLPLPGGAVNAAASFPSASTAIIYYAHGSSSLSQADLDLIASVARGAQSGSGTVRVEGHASVQAQIADPVMRKVANLKISMDRAFKVTEALMAQGVPAERIETKAYGEVRPPANIPPGKDKNSAARRVEIYGLPESR